jgi:serine/threonine-protein kinase
LEEALDIAIQTGRGLEVAHRKSIFHRDIKSANVMVTGAPSGRGQVKIMDFGLAHLGEGTKITKTGSTLGTPAYMSPEQVKGEAVDHRADIWSLGVVLYEMVAGQLPFKGEVEAAVSYGILNQEPEPLTGLRTGLPIELDRVVSKALAKDAEERYQHVADLLADLRAIRRR